MDADEYLALIILNEAEYLLFSDDFDMLRDWVKIEPNIENFEILVAKYIIKYPDYQQPSKRFKVEDLLQVYMHIANYLSMRFKERFPFLNYVTEKSKVYKGVLIRDFHLFYSIFDIAEDSLIKLESVPLEENLEYNQVLSFIKNNIESQTFDKYTQYFRIFVTLRGRRIIIQYRSLDRIEDIDKIEIQHHSLIDPIDYTFRLGKFLSEFLRTYETLIAINPVCRNQLYVFFKEYGMV